MNELENYLFQDLNTLQSALGPNNFNKHQTSKFFSSFDKKIFLASFYRFRSNDRFHRSNNYIISRFVFGRLLDLEVSK